MHRRSATHVAAWLLLCSLLILMLTPLTARASALAADKNTLVLAYFGAPASLDPGIAYDYAGPAVLRAVYNRLVQLDGTSTTKIAGDLAASWTSNANKTLWTFSLRHGITFHDGTPVNAAAIKYSIERMQAINQAPAYVYGQFVAPKDIEIVDTYTFRLHLHAPAPRLLYAFASLYGTWIVSPGAIKAHATTSDPWAQKWLAAGHDAGSGPYEISSYTLNQSVILTAYPHYWLGWSGHHVSRVIFDFVAEDATRRALIEKGDADITQALTPEDLKALEQNQNLIVDSKALIGNWTLVPTEHGVFASAKARQALAYAFDYNGFLNGLMQGFGQRAQGPMPPYVDGHDKSLFVYQTDLTKAKALFSEAGITAGAKVTMWYPNSDESQKNVALVTQAQLGSLGITVNLVAKDAATYSNALYGAGPFAQRPDLWVNTWSGDYNDAISWFFPEYHTKTGSYGGANPGYYHNATADKLMEQAAVTTDLAARNKLLDQVQQIITVDDPAAIYVGDESNTTTYQRSLHGYYYNTEEVYSYDVYHLWK